jgi:hypothetical protein
MANLDEPNDTGNGGEPNEPLPVEQMSRLALEARVRELEHENASLRLDVESLNLQLQRELRLSHALAVAGVPVDRCEQEERAANSESISQVLARLERGETNK